VVVGDSRIAMLAEPEVKALPWAAFGVDVVVEATGTSLLANSPPAPRCRGTRVVVSAPSKGADATFCHGSERRDVRLRCFARGRVQRSSPNLPCAEVKVSTTPSASSMGS